MEDEKKEEEVHAQFVDPASLTFFAWLFKLIVGSIIWTVVSFFTKLGLDKYWKK